VVQAKNKDGPACDSCKSCGGDKKKKGLEEQVTDKKAIDDRTRRTSRSSGLDEKTDKSDELTCKRCKCSKDCK
jgi:hypothetical protein